MWQLQLALGLLILFGVLGTIACFMARDIGWRYTAAVWGITAGITLLVLLAAALIAAGLPHA